LTPAARSFSGSPVVHYISIYTYVRKTRDKPTNTRALKDKRRTQGASTNDDLFSCPVDLGLILVRRQPNEGLSVAGSMPGLQVLQVVGDGNTLGLGGTKEILHNRVSVVTERDFDGAFEAVDVTVVAGSLVSLVLSHQRDFQHCAQALYVFSSLTMKLIEEPPPRIRSGIPGRYTQGLLRLDSPASMSMTWRLWSRLANRPATTQLKKINNKINTVKKHRLTRMILRQ
ncbi:hypothetical protein KCU81_g134, partial [Aureobasidium melanogenum]